MNIVYSTTNVMHVYGQDHWGTGEMIESEVSLETQALSLSCDKIVSTEDTPFSSITPTITV